MTCLSVRCCCPIALALCVISAAAFDMDMVGSHSYELHPAQAPSPSLRLTGWLPQHPTENVGLTLAMPNTTAPVQPLTLDLGVRWRSSLGSHLHMEFSAWGQTPQPFASAPSTHNAMGMIRQRDTAGYARMELQWSNAPTRGLLPEHGAIGMQLQGGSRVVLRAKRGGPMVYFRARF